MSYILDALKRADAERERGQVPGLHSQAGRPTPPQEATRSSDVHPPRRRWVGIAALALLSLTTLAVTLWTGHSAPPAPAPAPTAEPALAAPTTPLAPQPAAVATTPAPPVAPILAPAPAVASVPTAPITTLTPTASQKSASPVIRFADLSAEQRAQLPQLNISGASYSENPAHRLLIVNGQVVQEAQEVAPGLLLEHIGASEAVLNQRGLRFSVGY